jgi:HAD superfamily hydrolase (TIGR01549 family)
MIKAVLLDVYGTLLDTYIFRSSLRHIADDLGLSEEERIEAVKLALTTHFPTIRDAARAIERMFGRSPTSETAMALTEMEIAEHLASFKLFDGVPGVIDRLRSGGHKLALVTNVSSPYLEPIMRLGVNKLVDHPVYSCKVGFRKPDPEIFRIAMETLEVTPEETVMVGDNPRDDVEGAIAAGIKSVLIDAELDYPGADLIVPSIRDVPGAVLKLNG